MTTDQAATDLETRGRQKLPWAILFALAYPTALTYVYFVYLMQAPQMVQHIAYGGGKILQFGFPLFWVYAIERQEWQLHRPRTEGMLAAGGFGLLVALSMWALYYFWLAPAGMMDVAAGPIRDKVAGFGIDNVWTYAAFGLFYTLIHSLAEEYYWRWFVYAQSTRVMSVGRANLISSLGFTAHHVLLLGTFFGYSNPITWIFSTGIAVGGAVWAWLYQRNRSLYPVWLSHALVDAAIFSIGYHLVQDLMK